jgi:VanZ family protein
VREMLRAWGPALVWTLLIFAASSLSALPVSLEEGRDKLAHFAAYTVLGFFLVRALYRAGRAVWPAVPIGWVIGALDEVYQGFVPGRTPSVADWVADALGVAAGFLLYLLIAREAARRPRRASQRPQPQDG